MSKNEVTQEEREELLENEDELLAGILEAHEQKKSNTRKVEISRKGKVLFSFTVMGIDDSVYDKCKKASIKYSNGKNGRKFVEEVDTVKGNNLTIYHATIPEDRKKIWDNKKLWERLNVLTGHEVIEKVLLAGEKDALITLIDELSGVGVVNYTEEVKN
ncbi:phage tail assembly chaperone [Bacillus sp. FJAT-45350]|uniref:phage tail assembly chaperone n=1 Tax=Bacillus sp. FJAT-45350 TaxID=2011014 RepID=UPI000BB9AE67|nr:hypothetical protein [Bacillus sp. FJAT-45350]